MHIQMYSDMVCPWCRIGKKNLRDAILEWSQSPGDGVTVSYHAFLLDPTLPPEGLPFKPLMEKKFGGPDRLAPMLERVTQAGADVGVAFRFDRVTRMPNTVLAHRLTYLVPENRREEWIDAVMTAYFEFGKDIADRDVLLEIAGDLGLEAGDLAGRLAKGEGEAEVNADLQRAQKMGITGVPFFVIDGKYALSGAYPAADLVRAFAKISGSD
ncbi:MULTISPECIES: DsbA family oxidoreductase [Cohnella]|uniref:DsbA family oxidoreductase n=1 Tax=Cohnella TaxID=329857 RepID=UPI000E3A819D|nr:DsbA family oxidoreductase [Cohnella sp.]REK66584.1 MAG: DsbA family oxidoreductase [Cohnella sp.]